MSMSDFLFLIPALPFAGFLLSGLAGRRLGVAGVSAVSCGLPAAAFLLSVLTFTEIASTGSFLEQDLGRWIGAGALDARFSLRVDALSAIMLLVVYGVGGVIHFYSIGYMREDKGYSRYFAFLNLFLASMAILVMAGDLLFLFAGWELVGLCSYLLIGFWYEDDGNSRAGMKAFVFNRIGDVGFLIGIFLTYYAFGTFDFRRILEIFETGGFSEAGGAFRAVPSDLSVVPLICLFLLIGATGKSAQIPLFVWLPDAMAGPTPVSALIHAATMVTAGIYMMARLSFLYAASPEVMAVVAAIGGATALVGALTAISQTDIKKVLAYSTVSQLGYMVLGCGAGAFTGSIFHIVTHSFFKAALFLAAGAVIHAMGGMQDILKMGGLRRRMPWTYAAALAASMALAGIPPLSGFFSKDEILLAVLARGLSPAHGASLYIGLYAVGVLCECFTAFYIFRWLALIFLGTSRSEGLAAAEGHGGGAHGGGDGREAPGTMLIPIVLLAVLAVVGGIMGVPHGGAIGRFLEGALRFGGGCGAAHVSGGAAYFNAAASACMAFFGAAAAWLVYARRGRVPSGQPGGPLHRISFGKFYFDEVYAGIGAVIAWTARGMLLLVDNVLLDGAIVRGIGGAGVRRFGAVLRRTHTGEVNVYAAVFLFGALMILACLALAVGGGS